MKLSFPNICNGKCFMRPGNAKSVLNLFSLPLDKMFTHNWIIFLYIENDDQGQEAGRGFNIF